MKNFVILSLLMLLTACSTSDYSESMSNPNPRTVTSRVEILKELDTNFCYMEGFEKFTESARYYTFKCKIGGIYRIPK